jgi:hypothetical protein
MGVFAIFILGLPCLAEHRNSRRTSMSGAFSVLLTASVLR